MTAEREKNLEEKIDALSEEVAVLREVMPALRALGELLVEANHVTKAKGLNPKTISKNKNLDKFQGIGERKLLLKLSSVEVVKQRRKPQ